MALTLGVALILSLLCVLESMFAGFRATPVGEPVHLDVVSAFPGWAEWVLGDGVWWFALVCAAQLVTFQVLATPRLHHASLDTDGLRNRFSVLMQAAGALTTGGWILAFVVTVVASIVVFESPLPSAGVTVFTGAAAGLSLYLGTELRQYHGTDVLATLTAAKELASQEAEARAKDFSGIARKSSNLRWLVPAACTLSITFLVGLLVASVSGGALAEPFWIRVVLVTSSVVILVFMLTWAARVASASEVRGLQLFMCFVLLAPASLLVGATGMVILTPVLIETREIAWFYIALAAIALAAAGLVVFTYRRCRAHRLQRPMLLWTFPAAILVIESRHATARLAAVERNIQSETARLSRIDEDAPVTSSPVVPGSTETSAQPFVGTARDPDQRWITVRTLGALVIAAVTLTILSARKRS